MSVSSKPSQEFITIKEIHDGIVVLKNGHLLSISIASTLNFALKSQDEQTAILLQYQNFLNSLDFSIQFFIESRRLDIRPYLMSLEAQYKNQNTDLMRTQVREYINFIRNFTDINNVMSKSFYVIVPYEPPAYITGGTKLSKLFPFGKTKSAQEGQQLSFQEHRAQLEQRVAIVQQGLAATGVRTEVLGTEELIELYYKIFNPGELTSPSNLSQAISK